MTLPGRFHGTLRRARRFPGAPHAAPIPFVTGSMVEGKPELAGTGGPEARGFALTHRLIASKGLDLPGAVRSHGNGSSLFSPNFLATYPAAMARRPVSRRVRSGSVPPPARR